MRWLIGIVFLGVIAMVIWQVGVPLTNVTVLVADTSVRAEVVRTADDQAKGLGGHAPLGDNEAMLFPYKPAGTPTFWMKGMTFSIDLLWIGDGEVIGIETEMPVDDGERRYLAPRPVDYVLEVRAGFVRDHGIRVGDSVKIRS